MREFTDISHMLLRGGRYKAKKGGKGEEEEKEKRGKEEAESESLQSLLI